MRRSVYRTASFSVCSLRRPELPVIYADLRLDYKLATHPIDMFAVAQPYFESDDFSWGRDPSRCFPASAFETSHSL